MREREEEEQELRTVFRQVLHNIRVGVSVCQRLQNVCVGAQLWVSNCSFIAPLEKPARVYAFSCTLPALCLYVCFVCALQASLLRKNPTHTHLCVYYV